MGKLEETLDKIQKHFVPAFGGADRFLENRLFNCYLRLGPDVNMVCGNFKIIAPGVFRGALKKLHAKKIE